MVANVLTRRPPSPPQPWGWVQKSTLSEHNHVANQIKWNHECSNMVANILPPDLPPPTLEGGVKNSKFNMFSNVAYQIKGNDACNIEANIFYPQTPVPNENSNISEHGHVSYQINWNHECSDMIANIFARKDPIYPGSKGQNLTFSEHGHVAYQI